MHGVIFVTGTDTGVGKTVFTCLLLRYLRRRGENVGAVKPFCSGGREDALRIRSALGDELRLDEINPWFYRAPVTPLLAARRAGKRVGLDEALSRVRAVSRRFDTTLVEGAGGLLSPLGEGFSSKDLILRLRASVLIVCLNRLGAINQSLLVFEALPKAFRQRATVVLMNSRSPEGVERSNIALLEELMGPGRVVSLPHLGEEAHAVIPGGGLARRLHRITQSLGS